MYIEQAAAKTGNNKVKVPISDTLKDALRDAICRINLTPQVFVSVLMSGHTI